MNRLFLLALGAAMGFGLAFAASHFAYGAIPLFGTQDQLARFGLAFERVRDNYLEKPEDRKLVENAIGGMLTNLDAHSSYFDRRAFDAMETKAAGAYGGIGLIVTVKDGIAKVVSPIEQTPASRAGLKAEDVLVAIDGVAMKGHTLDDVSSRMRGTIGTEVALTVARGGAAPFDLKLTRQAIEVERLTFRREGDVGYIKILAFSDRTDPDLRMAVATLKQQIGPSLKGFVIDLRNNGGGVLQASIGRLRRFPRRGRDRLGARPQRPQHRALRGPLRRHHGRQAAGGAGPMAAPPRRRRSSPARCRTIVAPPSWARCPFGKGSVQSILPLENGEGGALHITTARYYTPAGRSIQATGIVPDIVVSGGPARRSISAKSSCRITSWPRARPPSRWARRSSRKPGAPMTTSSSPWRWPSCTRRWRCAARVRITLEGVC